VEAYDPEVVLGPAAWLALQELDRVDLIEVFHREAGGYGEDLRLHSVMHAAVENQLAAADPPEAQQALSRLMADGLTRHDALHAIGSVFVEFLFPVLKGGSEGPTFDAIGYARSLTGLTVERWRSDV
jgi:hypothetical protein